MVSEAALGVMVLAVHICGDGAADGHLPGARKHRDPEPEGQQRAHQQIEADTSLDRHSGRFARRVQGEDAVHLGEIQRSASSILGCVAIAAAETSRYHTSVVGPAESRDGVGHRVDLREMRHRSGCSTPAVQLHQRLRNHWLLLWHGGLDCRYGFVTHSQPAL